LLVKASMAATGTSWRSMVRRRSTVRFRKGAPQVRRVFRLPNRGPLPVQGEGPEFTWKQKPRSESMCRLSRRCSTVPVGRKVSTVASLTGSFALACERPPSGVQCRWGQTGGQDRQAEGQGCRGRVRAWWPLTSSATQPDGHDFAWRGRGAPSGRSLRRSANSIQSSARTSSRTGVTAGPTVRASEARHGPAG
jgi:hypothetical protein